MEQLELLGEKGRVRRIVFGAKSAKGKGLLKAYGNVWTIRREVDSVRFNSGEEKGPWFLVHMKEHSRWVATESDPHFYIVRVDD
jgi:hypothetical protein